MSQVTSFSATNLGWCTNLGSRERGPLDRYLVVVIFVVVIVCAFLSLDLCACVHVWGGALT